MRVSLAQLFLCYRESLSGTFIFSSSILARGRGSAIPLHANRSIHSDEVVHLPQIVSNFVVFENILIHPSLFFVVG